MAKLELYHSYSRQDVHDVFAPDTPFTPQAGTWGILGIVEIPDRPGDFVLFVTFGKKEGDHEFDEGISTGGILRWQSQPRQKLNDKTIQRLIAHDEEKHSVYLFLRTADKRGGQPVPYTYLGRLRYIQHDNEVEQPVYFDWQLMDWPAPNAALATMQLRLEPIASSGTPADQEVKPPSPSTEWIDTQAPVPPQGPPKGTPTRIFKIRAKPDYAEQDKKNRTLGAQGEKLVVEHERRALKDAGRLDLAAKVRHIAEEEGDGAGFDVLSFYPDGRHRYIEVKTTRGGINSGFFLSPNEIEFSRAHQDNFELRRLYDLNSVGLTYSYYSVFGDLRNAFVLTPTEFKVAHLQSSN